VVVRAQDAFRQARRKRTAAACERDLLSRRWLVLAPHPDDETLGAGALLCALADAGRAAQVVYLTDGAASHPPTEAWPRGRLAMQRRNEARAALRRLAGVRPPPPVFLDWPDAAPFAPGAPGFARSADRLTALVRARRIDALAVTWRHEAHCDHAAAAALALAVVRRLRGRVRLYWYLVWGWDAAETVELGGLRTLALPDRVRHRARRRAALAAHRSQLGSVVAGGGGFRLPAAMVRAAAGGQLLFGPVAP
jgi:LmbE family N-acetylglucosaminyl deacetylase